MAMLWTAIAWQGTDQHGHTVGSSSVVMSTISISHVHGDMRHCSVATWLQPTSCQGGRDSGNCVRAAGC